MDNILITTTELDEFLTPQEIARKLKFKTAMPIYAAIKRGDLPAFELGRNKRVAREDLFAYLNRNRTRPPAVPLDEVDAKRPISAEDVLEA